jgi:hypothetical protein
VPEKADTGAPRASTKRAPRFRRPDAELIRRAARRVVRGGRAYFPSQSSFRNALIAQLRKDEPLATIGGNRLRRLLVGLPGVRVQVRYTERPNQAPPEVCPVCGSALEPIRNRTLTGETVTLGRRCRKCEYWTHLARRVPIRYTFSQSGIDGRSIR